MTGLMTALQESAGSSPDLGGTLVSKVVDGQYIEIGTWRLILPKWEPLQLGPVALDLSPTRHGVFLLLAAVLVVLVFTMVGRSAERRGSDRAPHGFANAVEAMVVFLRDDIVRRNIGDDGDGYTPFILTVFVLILFMNLLGLIPFGSTATGNLSVTAALAFLAFLTIEITGMRQLGFKGYMGTIFYAPHGLPPLGRAMLMVIMTPVEFLSKFTRPFALAIRLFANMTAGGILVYSLIGLIMVFADLTLGRWGVAGASVTMASAIMLLKLFVALLQAYIFAMLTAVFIGLIRHPH